MSEVVKSYYDENAGQEWERLNRPYSGIEFRSTKHLIQKYFPEKGRVCDIGSGPGRYAVELLKQGYNVTLFELSPKELELAAAHIDRLGLKAGGFICGDARELRGMENGHFEAALVLGPLYHILEEQERLRVIQEAYRVLKPGGIVLFGYINSWGALKAGVTEFSESFRELDKIYDYLTELKLDESRGFTECYFTVPPQALKEVQTGGFEILSYAGAEGFLAGTQTEIGRLYREDRVVYDNLLQAASETCEAPQFRDATEHLLVVARKPAGE
ncbi:hypothetical protein AWM70_06200 [Paenibacillus yonginensis]|uniref:Methyltransferase domain-containing protein n=1 Tax=Paenibacillus yonginensis TaxID=1462996 RepID=A0A1B1MYH8_9BACL|nr:class I SAM-dependent methyltransferase [Paenibacillus yonginensis]ANS74225.1 hypothetical protein AWM70_06200 [Paenibacillus yonginensis]